MFCTKCGTDNSAEARYCYKCGISLTGGEFSSIDLPHIEKAHKAANSNRISNQAAREPNFLVKHWRGDYSLGFSYWIIGSLLTLIIVAITAGVGSSNALSELGPRASGATIIAFYGFAITLTLWQLVGIWRSADKHSQRGGKAIWAGLAKVMVIVGLLRAVGDFTTQGIPLISEGAKLLAGIDNIPPHIIRLLRDGTELELAGGMSFGTTDAVNKFLDAAPTIQIIHLNSDGGRMTEAFQLYKTIKERNLITYTSADCVSACTIAFLAGRERYLGENGRLGFHSLSIGELSGEVANEINEDVKRMLKMHGAPNSFIYRALSTSPKDMWYPTKDELFNARIIDSVVDSRYFGLSGVSQWRNAQKIETNLLAIPLFSTLAQYDQQNYARVRDILVHGIQQGRTQREIHDNARSLLISELLPTYLKNGPDDALIRYWRSQITEMQYLAKLNPQYCVDFAFPQLAQSSLDLQRLLPQEILMEDIDAFTALIKGVAMNSQGITTNQKKTMVDLESVVKKTNKKYPRALEILGDPIKYKKDPALLCRAVIALYSEILAIPSSNRSASVLRYLVDEL